MVGFKVKFYYYGIGHGDFLFSFFSTVAYRIEKNKWGSCFPVIMKELYQGSLAPEKAGEALKELSVIKKKLKKFSPDKVVWNIDDLSKQPPWRDDNSPNITDLSNYFVTSDGEDFITIFCHALKMAEQEKCPIEIVSI